MVKKASMIWRGEESMIADTYGNVIAVVPLNFAKEASLHCSYLAYIAQCCVSETGKLLRNDVPCQSVLIREDPTD